ncbi:MAG: M23 family metallopeptidase [Deltaproteobacteria bacterium]|jgi:murein DD-endopeptidase MepM/ murein hydrolase activator NlpD|nr:M23 family metallopeptidase [Deltaproteobacteria bacterium]
MDPIQEKRPKNPPQGTGSRHIANRFRNLHSQKRGPLGNIWAALKSLGARGLSFVKGLFSSSKGTTKAPAIQRQNGSHHSDLRLIIMGIVGLILIIGLPFAVARIFKVDATLPPPVDHVHYEPQEVVEPVPLYLPQGLFTLDALTQGQMTTDSVTIQNGGNMSQALAALELTQNQIIEIIDVLKSKEVLSVVRPGDVVKAFWANSEKTPESLERLEFYREGQVRPQVLIPGGPTGFTFYSTHASPVELQQASAGLVNSNFWNAATDAGLEPRVILDLVDLLASQIDFLTDIRAGDSFQLLFLGKYLDGILMEDPVLQVIKFNNKDEELEFYRFQTAPGEYDYYDKNHRSIRKTFFMSPLQYRRVSSEFTNARLHPIYKTVRPHLGVDYAAPMGTPVSTVADGKVIFAGRRGGYGNLIVIEHDQGYETMYGHLSRFHQGIKAGVEVKQGDPIGYVGMTGTATGPHLDFRLKDKDDNFLDPQVELARQQGKELPIDFRQEFAEQSTRLNSTLNRLLTWDNS